MQDFTGSPQGYEKGWIMKEAIVVGKGVIGAAVAKELRSKGLDVLVLDSNEKLAGSPPSGGHMKPSWFSSLGSNIYEPALAKLTELFGFTEEQYRLYPLPRACSVSLFRLNIDSVLVCEYTKAEVTKIDLLETNAPQVTYETEGVEIVERCKLLVVAAGVWSAKLLPNTFPPKSLVGKQGVSFRFPGQVTPFIKPWAPYKQIVAHNVDSRSLWIGDGTAILSKNWKESTVEVCRNRCAGSIATKAQPFKVMQGIRPYYKAGKFQVAKIGRSAWVATGAGKHGSIVAGYAAYVIGRA